MKNKNSTIISILNLLKEWPIVFTIIGLFLGLFFRMIIDLELVKNAQANSIKDKELILQKLDKIEVKTDSIYSYLLNKKE